MDKIRVGIIGAGGYGGCGAIELLQNHPYAEIVALIDKQDVGKPISDLYPHLTGFCDLPLIAPDDPDCPRDFQVVFFATPDGVGQEIAPSWLEKGAKVIDYSGDFRFNDFETYKGYAARIGRAQKHASPQLLPESVYGLAELHRSEISRSNLVGNPGCFAVSCILGLSPAIKSRLIEPQSIICDAKTGVSGAGKSPNPTFHYPARYESMNAYKISGHQHVYEIERELGLLLGQEIRITFTPHVVPLCRGILSTIYAQLKEGLNLKTIQEAYRSFYQNDVFVRVFGPEKPQVSVNVRGSNFCNISLNVDERTGKLIVVSLIDNLVKGQAGSAVQNMNVMFGIEETAGLLHPGIYP
ncbi:MAG TPA: N-acetyl-gamma-glutamyl-phosphate reductase [Acidobacteriota bacterium]|nr:N-acetyl-gamma-glutamyl-phosphate reductase [Acidobacteriota bacterium]